MNGRFSYRVLAYGTLAGCACVLWLSACASGTPSGRGGYRASREVEVDPSMTFEDDYDYYPSYEVYYSRNRHEYVYFDRNRWVRSSELTLVSPSVLAASPVVRMDFRDSPARHHDTVVRNYPRDWRDKEARPSGHDDRKDEAEAAKRDPR